MQLLNIPPAGWTVIYVLITLILVIMASKTVLGWVFIPTDKSGLVDKKWSLKGDLPQGRIIATKGEAGTQAELLAPGLHWFKWWWMYSIKNIDPIEIASGQIGVVNAMNGQTLESGSILSKTVTDSENFQDAAKFLDNGGVMGVQRQFLRNGVYRINTAMFKVTTHPTTIIKSGQIGIVTTFDGKPIESGEIAAREGIKHNGFQDADMFLNNGGYRGLQQEVLPPGEYFINPEFAKVEGQEQIFIPIGHVGVVTSFVGDAPEDTSGLEFKHGIIVSNGQKGVQNTPLNPGLYPINERICKVEVVPTTNVVLNWANAKTEAHELDSHLSTIKARTKDGFGINLDVSQIINIPHDEAPKVIARFGTLKNLISQVLEPTIGNYFRNSVQESLALEFITQRKQRQSEAKKYIVDVLREYNVAGVDTLIGDVVPPEQLMEPIREKHIADQTELMYIQKKKAEVTRRGLETATAEANIEGQVVNSKMEVEISQRHAESIVKTQEGASRAQVLKAEAEATTTKMKAESESEAIKLKANAEAEATKATGNAKAEIVKSVGLAEAEVTKATGNAKAEIVKSVGLAEAEVIGSKGKATAEAYKLQIASLGNDNFASIEIAKQVAEGQIQLVPYISNSGGDGTPANSIIAMQTLDMLGVKFPPNTKSQVIERDEQK